MIEDDKIQPKVATEKPQIVVPNRLMTQKINISKAKLQEEQLTILKQDLAILADEYRKEYQQAYEEAQGAYNKEVSPIYEKYFTAVEEARKSYCSTVVPEKREYTSLRN